MINISDGWNNLLKEDFTSDSYIALREFLKQEYKTYNVFPSMFNIFNALNFTPLEKVKVVILGQDPYHNIGQAMGLAFSVPKGTPLPPSLKNIYKELYSDLGILPSASGDLTAWAKQGALLLNTSLTVREGLANSHSGKGWEKLTDSVIHKLSLTKEHLVFMLWGANARSKKPLIDSEKHLILECAHPSPLSAYNGFFGCKHFSKCNEYLEKNKIEKINWELEL